MYSMQAKAAQQQAAQQPQNFSGGLGGFTNWAQQPFDWSNYANALQGFGGNAFQTILDTASGANLHGNPYLDATYADAAKGVTEGFNNNVLPNIAAQFGGAGRTGGGLHHGAVGQAAGGLTDSLSQMANSMYGANYANERQNQLGAASGLMDLFNTGSAESLQRLGLAGDMFGNAQNNATSLNIAQGNNATSRDLANQANQLARYQGDQNDAFRRWNASTGYGLDAAGLGANIYGMQLGQQQNALGMIPGLLGMADGSNMQQIQNLLAAGGLTEGYQQQGINEAMARWNYPYESQWDNINRYAGIVGNPVMENTSSSTSQGSTSGGSRFGNILGGALTFAGLDPFGWFSGGGGSAPSNYGPYAGGYRF